MGVALYTQAVLASSPAMYWPLDEFTSFPRDISGNNRPATTDLFLSASSAFTVRGVTGPFTGFKSVIGTGSSTCQREVVSTQQDNVTMELWFRPEIINADNQGLAFNWLAGSHGWGILINAAGAIRGICQGVAFLNESPNPLSLNTWYHIAVTRRSTVWTYFVNGMVDVANAGTTTPGASPVATGLHSGSADLQARYAHFAYYTTSLSNATILSHYQAAVRADDNVVASGLRVATGA